MVRFVGRIRDCTVTGRLQAAELASEWHHSRAHDFFAYRRWDPDELGLMLLDCLVSVFVAADAQQLGAARWAGKARPQTTLVSMYVRTDSAAQQGRLGGALPAVGAQRA